MRKWMPLVIALLAVAASLAVAPALPDMIAVHWDWRGQADGFAPKWIGILALPALMVAVIALFHVLPKLDPMRANMTKFWPEYELIVAAITAMMLMIHIAMLASALGYKVEMVRVAIVGVGILFVIIGNVMPRLRRNHIAGFRTHATLSSDAVWSRTHRFGGLVTVATGILVILGAFVPAPWGIPLLLTLVAAMAVCIALYSRRVAREHEGTTASNAS